MSTPARRAEALASLIHATLVPIVAPLVAEQAALRQVVERQADQLVQSAEQRIQLAAEVEQGKNSLGELQRRHDQTVAFARWLLLGVAVLALVATTLAVIVALAPVWVR